MKEKNRGKKKAWCATSGNRTRVDRVGGGHSTTEPRSLACKSLWNCFILILSQWFSTFMEAQTVDWSDPKICLPLKTKYEACFDPWYRDKFLNGDKTLPCPDIWKDYQECITVPHSMLQTILFLMFRSICRLLTSPICEGVIQANGRDGKL